MNMKLVEALTKECLNKIHTLKLPGILGSKDAQACGLAYYRALMVEVCSVFMLMNARQPDPNIINEMIQAAFIAMRTRLAQEGAENQRLVTNSPLTEEAPNELLARLQDPDSGSQGSQEGQKG